MHFHGSSNAKLVLTLIRMYCDIHAVFTPIWLSRTKALGKLLTHREANQARDVRVTLVEQSPS